MSESAQEGGRYADRNCRTRSDGSRRLRATRPRQQTCIATLLRKVEAVRLGDKGYWLQDLLLSRLLDLAWRGLHTGSVQLPFRMREKQFRTRRGPNRSETKHYGPNPCCWPIVRFKIMWPARTERRCCSH